MASKRVIVVGGGAAGIIAAWRAASLGSKVMLLEKTPRLGTKILISGGGKCNICHDGAIEDVLQAFRQNEARFLRPSVYRFPNTSVLEIFTSRGLEVYTRPDGRVFPVRQTAKEVVGILKSVLDDAGVTVCYETPVAGIKFESGIARSVLSNEIEYEADAIVISTGGSSYPNSGTTGDGWAWVREIGHRPVPIRAALAPIYLNMVPPPHSPSSNKEGVLSAFADMSGIALRDIVAKARCNGKEITRWRGDMLFTHQGISGPCALAISREIAEVFPSKEVSVEVDLRPDLSPEEVGSQVTIWVLANPRRQIGTLLESILPEKLVAWFLEGCQVQATMACASLPKSDRKRIIASLKAWTIGFVRAVPLEKGECVAGGVSLDEVEPQSMLSKFCTNLYLCGEILDIAGPVGGYNLQAAFSTGYVAGESAAVGIRDKG
jgi:predicted Rossmann fold flavoprotein